MKPVIGAVLGGVVGSLLWAGIMWGTHCEAGIIAWAVGGLVGFGSAWLGGSGHGNGAICGVVALLAIFGGKYLGMSVILDSSNEELIADAYNEFTKDAADFSKLKSEQEYAQFMVTHDYADADEAAEVTEEEIQDFKEETVPMLNRLIAAKPSLEQWKASPDGQEYVKRIGETQTVGELVEANITFLDFVFLCLGIATAFKIGSYHSEGAAA